MLTAHAIAVASILKREEPFALGFKALWVLGKLDATFLEQHIPSILAYLQQADCSERQAQMASAYILGKIEAKKAETLLLDHQHAIPIFTMKSVTRLFRHALAGMQEWTKRFILWILASIMACYAANMQK
eukprot:6047071-Prymnesium_polylepis.1